VPEVPEGQKGGNLPQEEAWTPCPVVEMVVETAIQHGRRSSSTGGRKAPG